MKQIKPVQLGNQKQEVTLVNKTVSINNKEDAKQAANLMRYNTLNGYEIQFNNLGEYEKVKLPEITDEQKQLAKQLSMSASKDVIKHHLVRLAAIKHLKGDKQQQGFLLNDFIERLSGITELTLFNNIENYIETDTSGFFPQVSQLKGK